MNMNLLGFSILTIGNLENTSYNQAIIKKEKFIKMVFWHGASSEEQRAMSLLLLIVLQISMAFLLLNGYFVSISVNFLEANIVLLLLRVFFFIFNLSIFFLSYWY